MVMTIYFYSIHDSLIINSKNVLITLNVLKIFYLSSIFQTFDENLDNLTSNIKLFNFLKASRLIFKAIYKKYDLFEDDILKIIYKDKVAIINYNTDQGFIIENPIFANFERKLFKLLFQFLKK
jgi:hypothetical protein